MRRTGRLVVRFPGSSLFSALNIYNFNHAFRAIETFSLESNVNISMAPTFTNFIWNTPTTSSSEPYRVRASKALEYIDWDTLALKASQTRNGVPCQVGVQFGFGGRHVVREIVFDDDTHWIARVSIRGVNFNHTEQYIPKCLSETWSSTREAEMQSEIDTVSYVSEFTDIPIPRIFAFDVTATNSVGAPYMLIECFKGTCGMDMPDSFADITPQFRDKYYNAEGAILVSHLEWKL